MEDPQQQQQQSKSQSQNPNNPISQVVTSERTSEPVRSRWTPKPEQILILESIFNSGMVNPPKDETVRIRKLLEKFGTVGDANVFYWFQNRRSRSRRRQRQMQAATAAAQLSGGSNHQQHQFHHHTNTNNNNSVVGTALGGGGGFSYNNLCGGSSSSSCGGVGVDVGFFSSPSTHQMNFPSQIVDHSTTSDASSVLYPSDHVAPNFNYHPAGFGGSSNVAGSITVFINGVATEVPRGLVDIKTVFGEDVMLVHSSGVSLPTNEFGFLMQSLQHGESYFLVSKQTQI